MQAFVRSLEGLLNREASACVWVDDPKMRQKPHLNISKNIILYKAPRPVKTTAGLAHIVLFWGGGRRVEFQHCKYCLTTTGKGRLG